MVLMINRHKGAIIMGVYAAAREKQRSDASSTIPRILAALIVAAALAFGLGLAMPENAFALKTINQKDYALTEFDVQGHKYVKNKNLGKYEVTSYETNPVYPTTTHKYGTKKGYKATLETFMYLPVSYEASGDMGNPQSFDITPDGAYAYVTYPKAGSEDLGRIVRYDLKALENIANDDDDIGFLVKATHTHSVGKELSDLEKEILACMKIGPWCKIGHGSTMAYNPKDGCLWFLGETVSNTSNMQRINMKTLKPDLKINFTFSSNEKLLVSNNLTFDKQGRCYFYNYSGSTGSFPEGAMRIYQGQITNNKKVSFRLTKVSVLNNPTRRIQSMGYNPSSNRLYMVADEVIMSVPVKKLDKLKKKDVRLTIFKGAREYEDIAFDAKGNGYVMVNKRPELLATSKGF